MVAMPGAQRSLADMSGLVRVVRQMRVHQCLGPALDASAMKMLRRQERQPGHGTREEHR